MATTGVRKIPIGALAPDINNALIVGVIIAKQNIRIFNSKKDGEERAVWNFTLRDSPIDTINATFWGSADGIKTYFGMFAVGDIIEVTNPRISFKQPGTMEVSFSPTVSSPFQLQLQEHCSEIVPHYEGDEKLKELVHIPTKAQGDFLRLSDVSCYGQAMKGDQVNLLVAIQNVGEVRSVKSKRDSKDLLCREIVVLDQSQLEFHITLWNEDVIQRAEAWKPRETVLFFADMKLDWSTFKRGITASVNSCTIITENPCTPEAVALRNYARSVPIQATAILDHLASSIVDPNNINTVMTTSQVLDKAYNPGGSGNQFTALMYVMMTHLDLDGSETVTSSKCSRCAQNWDNSNNCLNLECPIGSGAEVAPPDVIFNLRVSLTDHRGTLNNCRLVTPAADRILGCTVGSYLRMTSEQKTELKWHLLLERCEARVLVLCSSPERPRALISLLACVRAKPTDVSSKLPIY